MDFDIMDIFTKLLVLFTAIPVHECAHAWAAEKLGDDTGRNEGRITLNPFSHLTLWGSLMLVFIGFGWGKPVSVNPMNFKNPKMGMMLSSLAGPASNVVMAFLAMIAFRVLDVLGYFYGAGDLLTGFADVFLTISIINLSLAIFNFLPIPPLDGSKIFNAILPDRLYFSIMRYEQFIFIALFIVMRIGILDEPIYKLNMFFAQLLLTLTDWVEPLVTAIMGFIY